MQISEPRPDDADSAAAWCSRARQARGPVIESDVSPHRSRVTFVFADQRGRATQATLVCPALSDGAALMRAVGDFTFVYEVELPAGTRVTYHFLSDVLHAAPDGMADFRYQLQRRRLDRFNPRHQRVPVARSWLLSSVLELTGAVTLPGRRRAGPLRHGVASTELVQVAPLGHPVEVVTFRPQRESRDVVILLESAGEWADPAVLFDDLHDAHPQWAFLGLHLGGGGLARRLRTLGQFDGGLSEVVGHLLDREPTGSAGRVVVAGFSAAAGAALRLALYDPVRLSRVALLSGAFHLDEQMNILRPPNGPLDLTHLSPPAPMPRRVYLAGGCFEGDGSWGVINQSLAVAQALVSRGVDIRVELGPTGHELATAAAHLASGLGWLLPA